MRNSRVRAAGEAEPRDVEPRAFQFSVDMVALCRRLAADDLPHSVIDSLAGLGARVGAETARARGSNSRRAHLAGMTAARKACEELDYWLRLVQALQLAIPGDPIPPMLEEARSLKTALTVVCAKARQHIELEKRA